LSRERRAPRANTLFLACVHRQVLHADDRVQREALGQDEAAAGGGDQVLRGGAALWLRAAAAPLPGRGKGWRQALYGGAVLWLRAAAAPLLLGVGSVGIECGGRDTHPCAVLAGHQFIAQARGAPSQRMRMTVTMRTRTPTVCPAEHQLITCIASISAA
jgi:hypothetical protein